MGGRTGGSLPLPLPWWILITRLHRELGERRVTSPFSSRSGLLSENAGGFICYPSRSGGASLHGSGTVGPRWTEVAQ